MTELNMIDKCTFAMNGQDAIDKIKQEVHKQLNNPVPSNG